MVITKIVSLSPSTGIENSKHFKCLFLDVGLAARTLKVERISKNEHTPDPTILGKLYEQFVGQELLAGHADGHQLSCWIRPERTAKAEVDYMIPFRGNLLPIEVKSGAMGKMRSLQVLLNANPQIPHALVMSADHKFEVAAKITRIPIYTRLDLGDS
jgi:predicted AAA+ superfamily ATPase